MSAESKLLRAALTYAEHFGFMVFPCKPGGKTPLTEHGYKDARRDPSQIRKWWERWPEANIGIATGTISGIVVLDIDPRHGGDDTLEVLRAEHGKLPETPTVLTGGGGFHSYLRHPGGVVPNSVAKVGQGIDVRGDGGYVIAPESIHESGNPYSWKVSSHIRDIPLAEPPSWLLNLITSPAQSRNGKRFETPPEISDGMRNDTLYKLARSLRASKLNRDEILATLRAVNESRCKPPLDVFEVEQIAHNAATEPDRPDFQTRDGEQNRVGSYSETERGFVRAQVVKGKEIEIPLTNFTARIISDITHDDGAETTRAYGIEARLGARSATFTVPASQFAGMRWPTEHLGAQAVVYAGQGTADHTRAAIQLLSKNPVRRMVYAHTGWRKIANGWVYLHADGAIGGEGTVEGVEVSLPPELAAFKLELPADSGASKRASAASLRLLDVGPDRITIPALGAVWRSILGGADFSNFLYGPTGVFKTELAALIQQHFGAGFDARHLPTSFTSTANTNEALAFTVKDAVLVVDELHPPASGSQREAMHRDAPRLLRSQGNSAGRGRMRADGTLRPSRPPRGVLLATGEELPRGQSVHARLFTLEIQAGAIDVEKLTNCQAEAADGLYAQATAAFVHWLAAHWDEARAEFERLRRDLRSQIHHDHARTADIRAQLTAAYSIFIAFLMESEVIDADQADRLQNRIGAALKEAANAQGQFYFAAEPTGAFIRLLTSAIGSGRAHLADTLGDAPKLREKACGWRKVTIGTGDHRRDEWQPQGDRVGWLDGHYVYLNRDAAYRAAQGMAADGAGIEVSAITLVRRLHDKGLIARTDKNRETLTIRETLDGRRQDVVCLLADILSLSSPQPDQSDHDGADGRISGRGAGRDNGSF
ncbi:MAG: bifunctional DNA primase/polymerase [Candidatus Binataceae bacterium]